jgi:hypothetical protein
MRRCLAGWRCSVAESARRDAGAASLREIREKGKGDSALDVAAGCGCH